MNKSNVPAVYVHVVDEVISMVRDDFIRSGGEEALLMEIQELWEMKMVERGIISGDIRQQAVSSNTRIHDLNLPYVEYEFPMVEMPFRPTPMEIPIQNPLPSDQAMYNIPTRVNDIRNDFDLNAGSPSPYMQPPFPWMSQRPLGADVNMAYVEDHEEMVRVPSLPMTPASQVQSPSTSCIEKAKTTATSWRLLNKDATSVPFFPQQDDGIHDYHDNSYHLQESSLEDPNILADHVKSENLDDAEPPLNEDDDDDEDLDDVELGDEDPNKNFVLAIFDKVTRAKNRWKCNLGRGIMHLNGRDLLFQKAFGEFNF